MAMNVVRLQSLVSALRVGDWSIIENSLPNLRHSSSQALKNLLKTASGAKSYALQAALSSPVEEAGKIYVITELLNLGANPNVDWNDCSGRHSPLSKALLRRHWSIAELLISRGADPTAALFKTDLLECCQFHPEITRWLIDRGANIKQTEAAVKTVLIKASKELAVRRQLSQIHASLSLVGNVSSVEKLLESTAQSVTVLLAAGAATVTSPIGTGLIAEDWAFLEAYASEPPSWARDTHKMFPLKFHLATRTVLLIASLKGFNVSGGGGSQNCLKKDKYWLAPLAVENIVKHMAY